MFTLYIYGWIRRQLRKFYTFVSISGLVVEYNVAIVVTRVRFPADACIFKFRNGFWRNKGFRSKYQLNVTFGQNSPDGTRTHNLLLRRETPYPLGHRTLDFLPKIRASFDL